MIIDTDKLRDAVNNYYDTKGEEAEKIQSDKIAIATLTRIETAQLNDLDKIDIIEDLARAFI